MAATLAAGWARAQSPPAQSSPVQSSPVQTSAAQTPAAPQPASMPTSASAPAIPILYLSRQQNNPSRASLLEPVVADYGLKGAEFGLQEINNSGRFLNKQYELIKVIIPPDGQIAPAARKVIDADHQLIVADLEARDLLAVADLPEAKHAVILDARTSDDSLRQADCRGNILHLLPNWAMRADGLGQYFARKKWRRWFLLRGTQPADVGFAEAVKRAARRFGATVVVEKTYEPRAPSEDRWNGREPLQAQIPKLTHTSSQYEILFVIDTNGVFGDYLLFNTSDPRLVAGTHGLVAEAWDPQFREYAARSVSYRFFKAASREMTERDYGNSIAMAIIGDAVTRGGKTDPAGIKSYLLSERFSLAANKGEGLTFRRWDQQLRQPLLLFGPRLLVSMAPQSESRHAGFQTDGLGFDQQDTACRIVH